MLEIATEKKKGNGYKVAFSERGKYMDKKLNELKEIIKELSALSKDTEKAKELENIAECIIDDIPNYR